MIPVNGAQPDLEVRRASQFRSRSAGRAAKVNRYEPVPTADRRLRLFDGFAIKPPNQVWASDLTYLPTAHGLWT
jgi:transposase InsO family protein